MRYLLFATITIVCVAQYLVSVHLLPAPAKFLPELASLIAVPMFAVVGIRQKFRFVAPKYWVIFASIGIVLLCGILANGVPSGPIIAGMRYYLRAVPFFLAGALIDLKEREVKQYLRYVLLISLAQAPLAVVQRFTLESQGQLSGDNVYGTLMLSGTLSMFLMCVECVLLAMLLHRRIGLPLFLLLFLTLLIPMSVNETKVTVFLLPLATLLTVLLGAPPQKKLKWFMSGVAFLVLAGAVFVPIYDYYNKLHQSENFTISEFLTKKGLMQSYLSTNAGVGTDKEAGRVDSIVVPLQELSNDPVKLAFGLGLGNASKSSLGPSFTGHYFSVYGRYGTSIGVFLLESGVLGTLLILLLHFEIGRDTFAVIRQDKGIVGTMAVGWLPAIFVITAGLAYIPEHVAESVSYLFFLFSGFVAAARMRGLLAAKQPAIAARAATAPLGGRALASNRAASPYPPGNK